VWAQAMTRRCQRQTIGRYATRHTAAPYYARIGDRFAQTWIGRIVRSAAYRRGDVAVFVTWDEDDYSAGNHVPLVVISPYGTPGSVARGRYTHYDLLRTIERTLGYAPLGAARTRSDGLARQLGLIP
jgi:hypothetical protein